MSNDQINITREEFESLRQEVDQLRAKTEQQDEEIEELRQEKNELEEQVEDLQEDKQALEAEVGQLQERVEDLETQPEISFEDDSDPVGSLVVGEAPVGKVINSKATKSDIDWIEEKIEEQTADLGDSEPSEMEVGDLTHIERISRAADDDISSFTDSVDARRAVAIWRNLTQWGKKTPKGYCLRPADNPLSLLQADQDENLDWKQYYRACEALEGLSEGAVTFCHSDRHGKMLVLHEQSDAFDRVCNSLTTSSAKAQG